MANRSEYLNLSWPVHFLTLVHALSLVFYQDLFFISVFLFSTFCRYYYLTKNKSSNIGTFFFIAHTDFSFGFLPLLESTGDYLKAYTHDISFVVGVGLLFCSLCYLAATLIPARKSLYPPLKSNNYYQLIPSSVKLVLLLMVSTFLLSLASKYIGVATMGEEIKSLPFKVVALINVLRIYIVPYLFIVLLESYARASKHKHVVMTIVAFVGWSFLESYIRLSRGLVIRNLIPVVCWLFYHRYIPLNKIKWLFVSVFLLFSLLFPFGTSLRQAFADGKAGNLSYILDDFSQRLRWHKNTYYIFQRLFPDGIEILKYRTKINDRAFFYEGDRFFQYHGNHNVHTIVVDQTPAHMLNKHSSGIGGLSDGYFLFGVPGIALSMTLFMLIFSYWDLLIEDLVLKSLSVVLIFDFLIGGVGLFSYIFYGSFLLMSVFPLLLIGHSVLLRYYKRKTIKEF